MVVLSKNLLSLYLRLWEINVYPMAPFCTNIGSKSSRRVPSFYEFSPEWAIYFASFAYSTFNVVYAIYGTWYCIDAHKVTKPYVRVVHSSRYSFYVIFCQSSVINYSRYIIRGVSHLSHRGIEYYKICTPTSNISVLPKILQRVPGKVVK